MDLATLRWLLTPDGGTLLEVAARAYADADGDPVRAAATVRRTEPDPERAAAALTQVGLRVRGVAKFGEDALRMYFTPDGLEQATRRRVADHRAARLAAARPGAVVDLGCGIGGDLLALARAGLVAAGVDLDPVRVAIAEANLAALGLEGAATVADATTLALDAFDVATVDPARRDGRGRVFDASAWVPSWDFVTGLLAGRPSVAKLAPGLPHDLVPDGVEAEWVSERGDVKEAVLWSPHLAVARRRATVLGTEGLATLTESDDPWDGAAERPVRPVGRYLYEPDGAVIRAGLVTAVAGSVEGGLLDEHIAYVVSDEGFRTPFATTYEVLEELPYREKQLRAALRERAVGRLTIKKRGVDVVPEQLRKRLALRGSEEATVVLTRVGGEGTALLVRPV
ncbi:class I SAM-dependent methyltransferase [Nocardioides zeae]|uniref:Class I SAM-dependent methyltransferase n=1 Tax=Nocardioides imazamoxiresistens TaxID=3231893 RepID=A0ABU3PR83_9ACTN|nr:class I SAM-dependent methyltransferase [Nocardioides zeae]MDT9591727.1 class I SAM-dependent methyltransferase [Nocardioides zeae]